MLADMHGIPELDAGFPHGVLDPQRVQEPLETAHRLVVLPIGHRRSPFNRRTGHPPAVFQRSIS